MVFRSTKSTSTLRIIFCMCMLGVRATVSECIDCPNFYRDKTWSFTSTPQGKVHLELPVRTSTRAVSECELRTIRERLPFDAKFYSSDRCKLQGTPPNCTLHLSLNVVEGKQPSGKFRLCLKIGQRQSCVTFTVIGYRDSGRSTKATSRGITTTTTTTSTRLSGPVTQQKGSIADSAVAATTASAQSSSSSSASPGSGLLEPTGEDEVDGSEFYDLLCAVIGLILLLIVIVGVLVGVLIRRRRRGGRGGERVSARYPPPTPAGRGQQHPSIRPHGQQGPGPGPRQPPYPPPPSFSAPPWDDAPHVVVGGPDPGRKGLLFPSWRPPPDQPAADGHYQLLDDPSSPPPPAPPHCPTRCAPHAHAHVHAHAPSRILLPDVDPSPMLTWKSRVGRQGEREQREGEEGGEAGECLLQTLKFTSIGSSSSSSSGILSISQAEVVDMAFPETERAFSS
ncbi:uncharacterized protein LOC143277615 [Babylonia areolata]|uniref:uncharacterized protein LOC143277615 n=1 Tax=Babylonia areolata TaxID=304850 RepID=UPI003FD56E39